WLSYHCHAINNTASMASTSTVFTRCVRLLPGSGDVVVSSIKPNFNRSAVCGKPRSQPLRESLVALASQHDLRDAKRAGGFFDTRMRDETWCDFKIRCAARTDHFE